MKKVTCGALERPPIRILHVITSLQTGGAEAMLAKLLANTPRERCEAWVVCLGADGPVGRRIRAAGIRTFVLGFSRRRLALWRTFRLVQELRRWRPTIVQGWMYHGNLAAWILRCVTNRAAGLVWNIRCTISDPNDFSRTTRVVIKACAFGSGAACVTVFNSRTSITQHVEYGFRPRRCVVLPNGFDLRKFAPNGAARQQQRWSLGVGEGEVLVGMIARYHPMKDFQTFIDAVRGILSKHPEVQVLLAGPNVDIANEELNARLKAAGILQRVRLMGELFDVSRVLPALDVLCLSSAWGEAFPNILGEAMACGVPCVATDVGEARDIIGDTGRVVPPRDVVAFECALAEIVSLSPQARAALGVAARDRIAARYDLNTVVLQYFDMYESLARQKLSRGT